MSRTGFLGGVSGVASQSIETDRCLINNHVNKLQAIKTDLHGLAKAGLEFCTSSADISPSVERIPAKTTTHVTYSTSKVQR